jgi:micrococcal nuclease
MTRILIALGVFGVAGCLSATLAGAAASSEREGAKPPAQRIQARITSVTDGDTIRVRAYGASRKSRRVRLIGIDTPETSPKECGAEEATDAMLRLTFTAPRDTDGDGLVDEEGGMGRRAVLVTDPTQRVFDRYDRLLAYVHTRSGTNLGLRQLSAGWGKVYVYGHRFREYRDFRNAAEEAKAAGRGMWASCAGKFHQPISEAPVPPPTPTPTPTPEPSCNPNYGRVCLPLSGDVDCSEMLAQDIPLVGTDVFRLDADGDDIGCES